MTKTTTAARAKPAPKPQAKPQGKPLPPHLARQVASDEIVVGTRITPLPAREHAALAYIRGELEAGRPWPTLARLAEQLDVKEKVAADVLGTLRTAEKIQVLTWEPYNGVGRRVPATFGLVPQTAAEAERERAQEVAA